MMALSMLHRLQWRVVLLIDSELEAIQPNPDKWHFPDHWVG